MNRIAYGSDPSHHGTLHLPMGDPKGVVVVIHGGFWKSSYDASLGEPLAESLALHGWAAWNIEYRRVGNGGGTPATFDDVAAAIEHLANLDLPLGRVITLGHSAGGHLAVWAAGHCRQVTAAVAQSGVLDLRAAARDELGGGAVRALVGDGGIEEQWDPAQHLPLGVPVRCVHTTEDVQVPISQSRSYVEHARAAGADATLLELPGDHFVHLDVLGDAWARTLDLLEDL